MRRTSKQMYERMLASMLGNWAVLVSQSLSVQRKCCIAVASLKTHASAPIAEELCFAPCLVLAHRTSRHCGQVYGSLQETLHFEWLYQGGGSGLFSVVASVRKLQYRTICWASGFQTGMHGGVHFSVGNRKLDEQCICRQSLALGARLVWQWKEIMRERKGTQWDK